MNRLFHIAIAWLLVLTLHSTVGRAQAPEQPPEKKIKVGVVISHFTATGPSWVGVPYDYWWPIKIIRLELRDPSLELYPVIEPGTAQEGKIPAIVKQWFKGRTPIECTDREKMKSLDVFVAIAAGNLTPEMIDGLKTAVSEDGHGLVIRMFFGGTTPGYTADVVELSGLVDGQYGFGGQDYHEIELTQPQHPILQFKPPAGPITLTYNGPYGVPTGQVLAKLKDQSAARAVGPNVVLQKPEFVFAPLYTGESGKGKIVVCAWAECKPFEFSRDVTTRSIQWLAGRLPAAATSQPATAQPPVGSH